MDCHKRSTKENGVPTKKELVGFGSRLKFNDLSTSALNRMSKKDLCEHIAVSLYTKNPTEEQRRTVLEKVGMKPKMTKHKDSSSSPASRKSEIKSDEKKSNFSTVVPNKKEKKQKKAQKE